MDRQEGALTRIKTMTLYFTQVLTKTAKVFNKHYFVSVTCVKTIGDIVYQHVYRSV